MLLYIGLGSNMGRRCRNINLALSLLSAYGITVVQVSSFYETAPWGRTAQPAFINAAASLETKFELQELLDICQQVEKELGRVRLEKWGPRTIDIDLLYSPGVEIKSAELTLPHPYILQRAFVLVPLLEISGGKLENEEFLRRTLAVLPDKDSVRCLNKGGRFAD